MMLAYEYEYNGNLLEIEYEYDPGEETVWTESNGDPGTPGIAPSIEIYKIWSVLKDREGKFRDVDVTDFIHTNHIESKILETHE